MFKNLSVVLVVGGAILLLGTLNASAQSSFAKYILGSCKPDIRRFCSDVLPGQGRIKACMKEHLPMLSEPCKEALFQAWLRQ